MNYRQYTQGVRDQLAGLTPGFQGVWAAAVAQQLIDAFVRSAPAAQEASSALREGMEHIWSMVGQAPKPPHSASVHQGFRDALGRLLPGEDDERLWEHDVDVFSAIDLVLQFLDEPDDDLLISLSECPISLVINSLAGPVLNGVYPEVEDTRRWSHARTESEIGFLFDLFDVLAQARDVGSAAAEARRRAESQPLLT